MHGNIFDFLGTTENECMHILNNKKRYYLTYKIKKRSGNYRIINAPMEPLKSIQYAIKNKILNKFSPHRIAHGFVDYKSPLTNAKVHIGADLLINIDIYNFFPSIKEDRVINLFKYLLNKRGTTWSTNEYRILARLSCLDMGLPQGAPTSPTLSNAYCLMMDKNLKRVEDEYNRGNLTSKIKITRYADDISVSLKGPVTDGFLGDLFRNIRAILTLNRLYINNRKTKIRKKHQSMRVTGIVINEKPNIQRNTWRNFRAMLHNTIKEGKKLSSLNLQKIKGYIEWVSCVNHTRGQQFLKQYEKILTLP